MKIILLSDVVGLGAAGELVTAKRGYARNYLIPRGMALEASEENLEKWEETRKENEARIEAERAEAMEQKEKIESIEVKLTSKAGDEGKLFGSITSTDIAEGLRNQHSIVIDRRKIEMQDNIRSLGTSEVVIRVYPDITASLKVEVEKE